MPFHFVTNALEACQQRLHLWSQTNRDVFDASKKHFRIIATTQNEGEQFKLLGALFDTMREEVGRVRSKASPKVKALLRTRPFYSTAAMVLQLKKARVVFIGRDRPCNFPRSNIAFGHP